MNTASSAAATPMTTSPPRSRCELAADASALACRSALSSAASSRSLDPWIVTDAWRSCSSVSTPRSSSSTSRMIRTRSSGPPGSSGRFRASVWTRRLSAWACELMVKSGAPSARPCQPTIWTRTRSERRRWMSVRSSTRRCASRFKDIMLTADAARATQTIAA
jgi:hypothetical protein